MTEINAAASGRFKIGGDLEVVRLGFGAMRITGKGIWGTSRRRGGGEADAARRAGTRHDPHRHRR